MNDWITRQDLHEVLASALAPYADRPEMEAAFLAARSEMEAEFAAVRAEMAVGDASPRSEIAVLRAEMAAGFTAVLSVVREELRELRAEMLLRDEQFQERITAQVDRNQLTQEQVDEVRSAIETHTSDWSIHAPVTPK